jgi:hypothetical protein
VNPDGCGSRGIRLSGPKNHLATGPIQKVRRAQCMGCVLSASGVPRQVMNGPVAALKKAKDKTLHARLVRLADHWAVANSSPRRAIPCARQLKLDTISEIQNSTCSC